MKYLTYFLLCVVVIGCDKDNPIASNVYEYDKYVGLPNTTREYQLTEWQYEANTSIPYVKVTDSLFKYLSFDTTAIRGGVAKINRYQEIILSKDTSNNKLKYYEPLTVYTQIKNVTVQYWELSAEMENVLKGKPYSPTLGSYIDGTTIIENKWEVGSQFDDTSKYYTLKKPLYIGLEWIRYQWRYKAANGNYETNQIVCKVVSKEDVVVKAGKYSAYKVEVSSVTPEINFNSLQYIEYYVPNVGLVLKEYDGNVNRTTISSDGTSNTIFLRIKTREELVSMKLINN